MSKSLLPHHLGPIDPARPVMTRDHRQARIICTDARCASGNYIVALVADRNGHERALPFFPSGRSMMFCTPCSDLVNVEQECAA